LLNNLIAQFCKANRKPGEYLFQDKRSGPMKGFTIRDRLERRGGLGAAPHAFRRFRVGHLRASRILEEVLKAEIGHASSDVTDLYSKQDATASIEACGLGFEIVAK
jgi:hypothetical protein